MRGASLVLFLAFFFFCCCGLAAADWNILSYINTKKDGAESSSNTDVEAAATAGGGSVSKLGYTVKNYCEAWRINVEMNNIRGFEVVPGECADFIGKYMESTQYKVDVQLLAEEALLFLTNEFTLSGDGKDAWIFDVNDVLLSTIPYYSYYQFGHVNSRCRGTVRNQTSVETWMGLANAPAVDHMLDLFHGIREKGLRVFIITSRTEKLRDSTVDNLLKVGYHGWTELIMRCPEEMIDSEESYKAEQRKKLTEEGGYRLWGIVGGQWSSLGGYTNARRIFKLPNPMYYRY